MNAKSESETHSLRAQLSKTREKMSTLVIEVAAAKIGTPHHAALDAKLESLRGQEIAAERALGLSRGESIR